MNLDLYKQEKNKLLKQRLQRVHTATGITFSLFMYVALFFGIFAILRPYIEIWEKPSRHFKIADVSKIDYGKMIDTVLFDDDYPKINPITITFPGYMQDPSLTISTKFVKTKIFNPNTNKEVVNEDKLSQLATFLNYMHYGRPFKQAGYIVFGLVAVGVMFLVLSGIFLVIKIKYKNNSKTNAGIFSKFHRKIFIWLFPPFIIITLTGAYMNIGYSASGPMTFLASKGQTNDVWELIGPVLFPEQSRLEKKNDFVKMVPINELLEKAKLISPEINFEKVTIVNWNDSSAIAKFEGYNPYMPFLNGISNKPSVTLKAQNAELIDKQDVLDKHWSGLFFDSIFFLHFLFGVNTFVRLFLMFIMIISTFAVGFGVLLWLERKSKIFPINIPVYQSFGKLSLAVMIGVIPATSLLFFLQWLLPFEMENRVLIQQGAFCVLWTSTFAWAFYRVNSYKTVKELLYLGGILFFLSPLIHFLNSNFNPISLYNEKMYTILCVDIGLFIFGAILIFIAKVLPSNRFKAQQIFQRNKE